MASSGRHEHNLVLLPSAGRYECSGCKERGANVGYKCTSSCQNYILHKECAQMDDVITDPILSEGKFIFRPKTRLSHNCNACGEILGGFVFESPSRHLRFYPLCMELPESFFFCGHQNHPLNLVSENGMYACDRCDKSKEGWRYECQENACVGYTLDLRCAKKSIHGLFKEGNSQQDIPRFRKRDRLKKTLLEAGSFAAIVVTIVAGIGGCAGSKVEI